MRVKAATSRSATPGRLQVSINGAALRCDGLLCDGHPAPEPSHVFRSFRFTGSFIGEGSTQAQLKIEALGGEIWVDDIEVLACAM